MMKDIVFDLNNVGICYRKVASIRWKNNKFWALHGVSFSVHRGETVGIIGRNGAGKSTLLKILADIIKPDTGTITRAKISVMMQSLGAGFDPRLTGKQNIFLSALMLGMDKNRIYFNVDDIIALADIGAFINEPIRNYSIGMRARLGFSIAYYIDADVMLIDEALATGDHEFKIKATELIKEKIKSDHTVVIVTHAINIVRELCDRVIVIEEGRSLPEVSLEESIEHYMNMKKK
ncbi:MAG: ABC transporter ATP-binding protein [Phycisphaerae bacterium]|nr:ABC transporter ATP-binding protein [Phycisphaerae bacterium]